MCGWRVVSAAVAYVLVATGLSLTAFEAKAVRVDNIMVQVTANPSQRFTYGGLASYTFFLRNERSSYLNNARFRANVNAGTFPADLNTFGGAVCTIVNGGQSIDCVINAAPNESVTIDLILRAPSSDSNQSQIDLDWNVRYGVGASESFITGTVSLAANSDSEAQAATLNNPLFLFTGSNNNVPKSGDLFTAAASVDPVNGLLILSTIKEDAACSPAFLVCVGFDVSKKTGVDQDGNVTTAKALFVPNSNVSDLKSKLVFVIRIDSTKMPGSIKQVILSYRPDGSAVGTGTPIPDCKRNVPLDPSLPCVANRFVWTKGAAAKVDPNLEGDGELEIWAAKNGVIDLGF